jgi:hypothetical protein
VEDSNGFGLQGRGNEKSTQMGVKQIFVVMAALLGMYTQPCSASDVTLQSAIWPVGTPCSPCVTFQFGMLSMRLPTDMIGRIFISAGDGSAVHVIPPGADARSSAVFLSSSRASYIGKYQALGLASAKSIGAEAFFDLLGRPAQKNSALDKIRHIESIASAEHFIKTSKGGLHAYWIQASPDTSQYLHIVVDGSDTIYTVAGVISPQLYRALLSGMTLQAEP